MASDTRKVNLKQTAYNVAGTMVAALIPTGEVEDPLALVKHLANEVYTDLLETHEAEPAPAPRTGGYKKGSGSGGGSKFDPATLEIKVGPHKGRTIGATHETHPDYIEWYAKEGKNEFLKSRMQAFLAQQNGEEPKAAYF